MKIALCGSNGKMGQTFYEYFHLQHEIIQITRSTKCLNDYIQEVDLVVDFTNGICAFVHGVIALTHKVPILIGTTGLQEQHKRTLKKIANDRKVGCIVCNNFSNGIQWIKHSVVNLLPYFKVEEIKEIHHQSKLDSPSGTSLDLAKYFDMDVEKIVSIRDASFDVRHQILLKSPYESITIEHCVNDRLAYMDRVGKYMQEITTMHTYKEV